MWLWHREAQTGQEPGLLPGSSEEGGADQTRSSWRAQSCPELGTRSGTRCPVTEHQLRVWGRGGEEGTLCGLLASHPLFDALQQKPCLRTPQQKGHCRGRGGGTMDAQDAKMLLQVL